MRQLETWHPSWYDYDDNGYAGNYDHDVDDVDGQDPGGGRKALLWHVVKKSHRDDCDVVGACGLAVLCCC